MGKFTGPVLTGGPREEDWARFVRSLAPYRRITSEVALEIGLEILLDIGDEQTHIILDHLDKRRFTVCDAVKTRIEQFRYRGLVRRYGVGGAAWRYRAEEKRIRAAMSKVGGRRRRK